MKRPSKLLQLSAKFQKLCCMYGGGLNFDLLEDEAGEISSSADRFQLCGVPGDLAIAMAWFIKDVAQTG